LPRFFYTANGAECRNGIIISDKGFCSKRKVSALMNAGMKCILERWTFFKRMLRSGRDFVNSEAVLSTWEHKRYA
jgi:hypothetical protein